MHAAAAEPIVRAPLNAALARGRTGLLRRLVAQYLQRKPNAWWSEIWAEIPNPYTHPDAMKASLRIVKERLQCPAPPPPNPA